MAFVSWSRPFENRTMARLGRFTYMLALQTFMVLLKLLGGYVALDKVDASHKY